MNLPSPPRFVPPLLKPPPTLGLISMTFAFVTTSAREFMTVPVILKVRVRTS
jgi:hypothetical protein